MTAFWGQLFIALLVVIVGYWLNRKTKQIHVLVNAQMTTALTRIADLEQKLSLRPGEPIPAAMIVSTVTATPPPEGTAGGPNPHAPSEPLPPQPEIQPPTP